MVLRHLRLNKAVNRKVKNSALVQPIKVSAFLDLEIEVRSIAWLYLAIYKVVPAL